MNFIETLKALPLSRQLTLAGAVLGVVFAMTFLVRGAMQEPMALLYAGLEPERAGEIISELEQRNIPYEIRQEAIFVPQGSRDRVRFSLAQEGLPKQNVQGYELLDNVNGFSVTSEMYNASYWRAKEGELTRTILAIPGVESARVHIGANLRSGFGRNQPTQTASVTLSSSRDLSTEQAEAIQYLVALAVAGLAADDVAVIDTRYGILAGPNVARSQQPAMVAETQASALEQKILRLLEARVGPGNATVSATVDVTRERQLISEIAFDPSSRVVRQRTTNDVSETNAGGGGAVTVASNLPQNPAGSGAGGGGTLKNSSESVAYELNETRIETERLPGEIKRISIAVLLNEQALGIDPAASNAADLAASAIAEFEQLIISAAGLDVSRGDAITVELMPFQEPVVEDLVAAPSMWNQLMERYFWAGFQALLLGLVIIILSIGVIRPIFARKDAKQSASAGMPGGLAGVGDGSQGPDAVDYLKNYALDRQDETAALLQEWLNEDQKVAVNE